MLQYFDSHCHIRNETVKLPDGIGVIDNAAKISDWNSVINFSQNNLNAYGAIGIHPWYVSDLPDNWDLLMYELLVQFPNLTIGEIGLDKKHPEFVRQLNVFVRQLELAKVLKRGVHIHCFGAWDIMREILIKQDCNALPFVLFHRFNGVISDWIKWENVFFSYSPVKKFRRILLTPQNRILLETDSDNAANIVQWTDVVVNESKILKENFVDNALRMLNNGQIA